MRTPTIGTITIGEGGTLWPDMCICVYVSLKLQALDSDTEACWLMIHDPERFHAQVPPCWSIGGSNSAVALRGLWAPPRELP